MNKPLSETHPSLKEETYTKRYDDMEEEPSGDGEWVRTSTVQRSTTDNAVLLDYLVDLQEQYSPVHFAEMSSQHFFDLLEQLKTNLSLIKDGDA